ncbi:MAG: sortase [Erysipelotrichaceae bacterium]|nr:sortase [Erysipelotrichaceae bacterium]
MVKKSQSKIGLALMMIGTLLVCIALFLFLYNLYIGYQADKTIDHVLDNIENIEVDNDDDFPIVEIDGYEYIGYLSVPSIDLTLPVMVEYSDEGLNIAPGIYSGSILEDNCVIAGHNYSRHFSQLKYLDEGTEIIFTSFSDISYHYEIAYTEVLQPSQIEEMCEGDWDLTLFTCTTGGSSRYTIRCDRTS